MPDEDPDFINGRFKDPNTYVLDVSNAVGNRITLGRQTGMRLSATTRERIRSDLQTAINAVDDGGSFTAERSFYQGPKDWYYYLWYNNKYTIEFMNEYLYDDANDEAANPHSYMIQIKKKPAANPPVFDEVVRRVKEVFRSQPNVGARRRRRKTQKKRKARRYTRKSYA